MSNLIGKKVLIVDEVDDTRTTLEYAVKELQKDVAEATARLGRQGEETQFSIFVLHVSTTFPRVDNELSKTSYSEHSRHRWGRRRSN
jgi:hypoxanthine phosphoribosyltransferase